MSPLRTLAIVCEAAADRETAAHLADRVLCRETPALQPEDLDSRRRWQGLEAGSTHLEWHAIKDLARERNLRAHGHFSGHPAAPDARAARLALLLLKTLSPDAIVLVRDSDGDDRRRQGLEQARTAWPEPIPVVLGVADPKRECWVLAGFDPGNPKEEKLLRELIEELSFDPRTRAEKLSAKNPGAKRQAKRVLASLVAEDPDRERACWTESSLDLLAQRGRATGLSEYLEEVRTHLLPIFS